MADVIAESGLSAGAVYGYFDSKNALLMAVADEQLGRLGAVLDSYLVTDSDCPPAPPPQVIRDLAEAVAAMKQTPDGDLTVAVVQIWGEAVLGGEVHDIMQPRIAELERRMVRLAGRWRDAGMVAADADPRYTARVLLAMLPGYMLQGLILEPVTPEQFAAGVAAFAGAGTARESTSAGRLGGSTPGR